MTDIQNLNRDDLRRYYRTYYSPNNAFLVVVGDFSTQEMLGKIKEAFGKIPRGTTPPKMTIQEPPQTGEKRLVYRREAELPFLAMYYHVPTIKDPDSYALDLLSVILGSGKSSRLYHELVYRKRIARGVEAEYAGLSIDPTLFTLSAQVMPDKDSSEVERTIDTILERLKNEPMKETELKKAKNQVESTFVYGQDSIFGQSMRIGQYESAASWQLIDQYLPGIRKVTVADIQRVAKKYLDADKRTVGLLVPTKEKAS